MTATDPPEPFVPDGDDDAFSAFLGYYEQDQAGAWAQLTDEGRLFMFQMLMEMWGQANDSAQRWKKLYDSELHWKGLYDERARHCQAHHREKRR